MNVDPAPRPPVVDVAVGRRGDMRRALATRDLAEVFRLLRRVGLSQRTIATMTGLSPSEVYEILHGRQVMSYDVLCRIGDGLGMPRGWLGLAYDLDTAALITGADQREPVTALADVQALLAHAAAVTMDVTSPNADRFSGVFDAATTPVPARIGHSIQARTGGDASLVANVLYRTGRLHLHDGMAAEALRFFQLGQIAAQESGCALTVAMLSPMRRGPMPSSATLANPPMLSRHAPYWRRS
ncbi:MAG: helix-turn-helix transcriptional regulator [Pseudonocardiales bacterium]|nr:helix-turn-helix transcriptional regulator [Pseudonocardiales bacterium]